MPTPAVTRRRLYCYQPKAGLYGVKEPFKFTIQRQMSFISNVSAPVPIDSAGTRFKGSIFRNASKKYSSPQKINYPIRCLFSKPQYNTWIELVYNQNETDIIKPMLRLLLLMVFQPGVMMIDDNWADYYGRFDFRSDRFGNAAAMVDTLHKLGFKVMLWVSPLVSPDTEVFRDLLKQKNCLLLPTESKKQVRTGKRLPTSPPF
jgi:hypothetical protein